MSQTTASFDRNTAFQVDVTTTINFGKNANNTTATLEAVKVGGTSLIEGTDYTLVENTLTIKKEYLATKTVGVVEVSVEFSAGTAAQITITVVDTTETAPPLSIVSKPIQNLDFSTTPATLAKLVSKSVTVGDFTGNRKDFTIVVGGDRIPIYVYWALSTDFPRGAAMGAVVDSHIQQYYLDKGGVTALMNRPITAYGFNDTFQISAVQN